MDLDGNVSRFPDHADDAIALSKPLRKAPYSQFVLSYVDSHGRDDDGSSAIAALLMEGRAQDALALTDGQASGRRVLTTHWSNSERGFIEAAKDYLERCVEGAAKG
ncbi:MAG: hypothetical protein AAGF49_13565 [Pseudomonadota bacterium]